MHDVHPLHFSTSSPSSIIVFGNLNSSKYLEIFIGSSCMHVLFTTDVPLEHKMFAGSHVIASTYVFNTPLLYRGVSVFFIS